MYWRILAFILLAVSSSYILGRRSPVVPEAASELGERSKVRISQPSVQIAKSDQLESYSYVPANLAVSPQVSNFTPSIAGESDAQQSVERFTLDIPQESQRIAGAAGLTIGAIQVTDDLPGQALMAMTLRRGYCVLLVNRSMPFDGLTLFGLSAYGKRQLTFTLGHEIGHCYVMTGVARRDPAILPSLSPPGKAYGFEQYIAMMGNYSEYPDLNRWNEEWADTFSAFILSRVYGRENAVSVTNERFALRKDQEKNSGVLISNIYGGHGSLADESIFSIQSPMEIPDLVKLGRLNTNR